MNITEDIAKYTKFNKSKISKNMKNVARHHIDSFDFAMTTCLERACMNMMPFHYTPPEECKNVGFKKLTLWYDSFELGKPTSEELGENLYPSECRERGITYTVPLFAIVSRKFDDEMIDNLRIKLGEIPVMVGSKFCNLHGMNEKQLVHAGEDLTEFGGYFIVNGNEKVIRMLIVGKRNYPVVFSRGGFANRGNNFTSFACQMR